jgi:transcriptional regulator of arginine metabolism
MQASKRQRHHRILELVGKESLLTQQDLCARLAQLGVNVTQATLSRDIKELGLIKTADGYAAPSGEAPSSQPSLAHVLGQFALDVREAQNLLIVKTTPGSAQPVAVALDNAGWPELMGTIAGDDTLLAIASARKAARIVAKRIRELMAP